MNKRVLCAAAAVLLTGLSSTVFVSAEPANLDRPSGSATAPAVKVHAVKVDPVKAERGRYIVKTAGCNDCHTPGYAQTAGKVEEAQWLTGDAIGWEGPWGTTFPINLRLFMQSMSAEQWVQIARTPARPPMPWFALRDMTDEDLLAIYHYVRSLGAAGSTAPAYLPPGTPARTPTIRFPSA